MLHAHLPFVRCRENEHCLEERWLYEAITETYIPLLRVLGSLIEDKVDFRVTLSLTPTLLEMFRDDLLRRRYLSYLDNLIELSEKELFRTRRDNALRGLARMYRKRFLETRDLFENSHRKDLSAAFGSLRTSGKVELITSAATHAYLPALMPEPAAVGAQIRLGADYFGKTFGARPGGMWLPECGFSPGIDRIAKEAGINFFFLDGHGISGGRHAIYAPVRTHAGVTAFFRDAESSKQVWSSISGYPGDFDYRDFYRDIGFDLDKEYLRPYLPEGIRTFTGLKYHRVTGGSAHKEPYVRQKALDKAEMHAAHFVESRGKQISSLHKTLGRRPLVTAAYDAELFGHWWFEGPEWLDAVLRRGAKEKAFRFTTPSEYLSEHDGIDTLAPSLSSWGEKGYSSTWINGANCWIYPHLTRAAGLMKLLTRAQVNGSDLRKRALAQAARELLLSQASDWAFMMKTGNASGFGKDKFREHMGNFLHLHREINGGRVTRKNLERLERQNNIFPGLDYKIFG